MTEETLDGIIVKYRRLLSAAETQCNEEKAERYESFLDMLENYRDEYLEDDYYEDENDLWHDYNKMVGEIDAQWNTMFPDGDENDAITDFLTN
jgi:hypothetical protein